MHPADLDRGGVLKTMRIAGATILVVLAIALLAIGGLWTFAQTDRGGQIIRRIAVEKVNARIAGHVAIDRLRFGGNRLTLEGVVLRDPEGVEVARVASVDLTFYPWALLRRHADVRRLEIRRPELRLVLGGHESDESNLARALAPAQPSEPQRPDAAPQAAGGLNVVVDLRALAVSGGAFTLRSSAPEIHVGAIDLEGSARYEGRTQSLQTDLQLVTDGGRVDAQGAIDLARLRAPPSGLAVRVRDLDLAKLMRDTPVTAIDLDVNTREEHLDADLRASAPGAKISGHGAVDGGRVEARAGIEATDLGATARSLARCHLAPPIVLAGQGRIDVALSGPLTRPSLRVAGRVPRLTVEHNTVRGLTVSATLPRLDAPTVIDLDLAATYARLGGRELRGLAATARASGSLIRADLQIAAPYPIALATVGHRLSPWSMEISQFMLRYPEATWSLARPTRIALRGERASISGLDLRARGQRVSADLQKGPRGGKLHLVVSHLDLGRLPRPLMSPALVAAGAVDLDLDLQFSPARLQGSAAARALGSSVDAKFDLPASWPPTGRQASGEASAPVKLNLTTSEIDLATVARTIAGVTGKKSSLAPRGKLQLAATVDGNAAHPRVSVELGGHSLQIGGRALGELSVALHGDDDRPLTLALHASPRGVPPAELQATTPLSLRTLLRRRPDAATLARTPFEINGQVSKVPLSTLRKLLGEPMTLPVFSAGTLSLQLAARGSAVEPTGTLAIDLTGVTTARIPATDARVELTMARKTTEANVRVVRLGHPLLALMARFGAGLGALDDRRRLVDAPFSLRAVIGPLQMQRLGLPGDPGVIARKDALRGTLHADLSVDGTLRAPRLEAHVQASNLKLDQTPIGYAQLEAHYANSKARVTGQVVSSNGGQATLEAASTADLGLLAILAHRLDPERWPFELRMQAQDLDLRGLSGMTPTLRRAGGLFDAELNAHGSMRDPRFSGRAACHGCELELTGVGNFRDIQLAMHGETDKVVLQELSAKDGDGNGRVTASLARKPGGDGYQLTGTVAVKEIPAYSDGQVLAHVSLNAALSGDSGGRGGVANAKVDIKDAHVKLSDEKRRKLQSLRTPDDVVLVDDGRPIDRAQAKKLKAMASRLAPSLPPKQTAADEKAANETNQGAGQEAPAGVLLWKRITIAVTAPDKLWVSGGGAALELGLGPDFRIVLAEETHLHGEVIVRRGRVDALGRRFDLKADSSLQFQGAPDHPTLDATAQYQDNEDNVTVLVTAKGPIDRLTIGVSSPNRPDLTQSQLYTLIITGHLPSSGGGSGGGLGAAAQNEAASLVAGVIAGSLQKTLAKHLPLDVLTIDTGGPQGVTGAQVEAGRYVTDKLYVGYVARPGADPTRYQNRNSVHVEYRLTARWQIAGEYGDVGTGSADLMWKKSY
jgi:translocation and assembly module TamB